MKPDQLPMSHRNQMDLSDSENIYSPVSGKYRRPTYVTTIEKDRRNFSPLSYHNTLEASGGKQEFSNMHDPRVEVS